ncbi:unnamed protein product [Echinostoma caproni]|uniref:Uncharacterized protein n=1 Tax=Echinostoma caproni TaxID=27848 RepID=A0A183A3K0_9TREM|nr:unnamed protein product [Echinostoma caproni]
MLARCEQHDDLIIATSSESVTLFQRQKTRPNRPTKAKCIPKRSATLQAKRNASISVCHVELTMRAPMAASELPGVRHAGKLATFGECVTSPDSILHSQLLQMTNLALYLRSQGRITQILYKDVTLKTNKTHKFIVDTESTKAII